MSKHALFCALFLALFALPATAEDGCAPPIRALAEHAAVEIMGTGDLDILVVTDPLCWHCRLGHKLLGEYPDKYRSYKLAFFPRRSFIGSDMAAWILRDAAGTPELKAKVDFAYSKLKQPKTDDLAQARALILVQFVDEFPGMLEGRTIDVLYAHLQKTQEANVLVSASHGQAAGLPGTPILIAGKHVVMGYGPGEWLSAIEQNAMCP